MADAFGQPSSMNRPKLSKVFSGQHLDDQSTYYARDSVSEEREDHHVAEAESDVSEGTATEKDKTERSEEIADFQNGLARDLEAPLEKKQSSKSVKDPNLVSIKLMELPR